MTQKYRELLLKDLCARLLYNPYCKVEGIEEPVKLIRIEVSDVDGILLDFDYEINNLLLQVYLSEAKPYLRPMSSMTEEEKADLEAYSKQELDKYADNILNNSNKDTIRYSQIALIYKDIDWYNKNHFDYRGLIPMGLALEAPEGMYKF